MQGVSYKSHVKVGWDNAHSHTHTHFTGVVICGYDSCGNFLQRKMYFDGSAVLTVFRTVAFMLCLEIDMTIGDEPNDKISKLCHSWKKKKRWCGAGEVGWGERLTS